MSKAKLVREPFCALAVIAAGRMSPGYGWSLNRTELNSIQFNANKSSQTEKKCQIEQAEERSKISERERGKKCRQDKGCWSDERAARHNSAEFGLLLVLLQRRFAASTTKLEGSRGQLMGPTGARERDRGQEEEGIARDSAWRR